MPSGKIANVQSEHILGLLLRPLIFVARAKIEEGSRQKTFNYMQWILHFKVEMARMHNTTEQWKSS